MYFITAPTAPKLLMIVSITNTTVSLSWMPPNTPNGIIIQYQLQYRRSDSSTNITSLDVTNDTLTYTVTGLSSNTEYLFTVRAFTVVGHGKASNEVTDYTSKLK